MDLLRCSRGHRLVSGEILFPIACAAEGEKLVAKEIDEEAKASTYEVGK